jgi:UDP-N-acetylglucosamine--N-acetylmuramyl-(pentapeptide) pyrophosphoryl-undecaprenol N-acetylglucosamine transferase
MRIMLVGGGTGGSVSPLIAVAEAIRAERPKAQFLFIGTRSGPERKIVAAEGIPSSWVPAGKWRRYLSLRNLIDIFVSAAGFFLSLVRILRFQPHVIFSAGSFVSVPVGFAGWLLRKPLVIHQQDLLPSLSNQILGPFATKITVTFPRTAKEFPQGLGLFRERIRSKVTVTGNPVRSSILRGDRNIAAAQFHLTGQLPTVLVFGGATGSATINALIFSILPEMVKYFQVIHITGSRRGKTDFEHPNYHPHQLLTTNMAHAYAVSDLVIARAGLATISELAALGKVAVIIPMPRTHQENNAWALKEVGAAIVLDERSLSGEVLLQIIRRLMLDADAQGSLREKISQIMPLDSAAKVAKVILSIQPSQSI